MDQTPSSEHVKRAKVIHQPTEIATHLDTLGPVDRRLILDHLLSKVAELSGNRYGTFLQSDIGMDVKNILGDALNPAVRETCENGTFGLER